MKTQKNSHHKRLVIVLMFVGLFLATQAMAANDPSIKGSLRKNIMASMGQYIQYNTVEDVYHLYDNVHGKLLKLKFKKLHDGIVKKGDFYVSCADFTDQDGRLVDVDFMVIKDDTKLKTIQAMVHSIDGNKRKYHLE